METDINTEEVLKPEPRELSGESLLTTEYLGVRAKHTHTIHFSLCMLNTIPSLPVPVWQTYIAHRLFFVSSAVEVACCVFCRKAACSITLCAHKRDNLH